MRRADLVPDCDRCVALCCVAPALRASEDFALDKDAGVPCLHLTSTHRCAIHAHLSARGFPGCAIYDCHGAGQRVTRACVDQDAATRNAAFLVMRDVHEWLWLLTEALPLVPPAHSALAHDVSVEIAALDAAGEEPASRLVDGTVRGRRRGVYELLRRVGESLGGRAGVPGRHEG